MIETVRLKASDGHELDAYVSSPSDEPIAGLVVIQEAFGVNRHIRSVADSYAKDGFLTVAPSLFDRIERGVELGYDGADLQNGIALARQINHADAVKDVGAALGHLRTHTAKKCWHFRSLLCNAVCPSTVAAFSVHRRDPPLGSRSLHILKRIVAPLALASLPLPRPHPRPPCPLSGCDSLFACC
jgi:hypothetical protein